MEAESFFKSPYYRESYYFPFNPDPLCRGNDYKIYDEMCDDDQVKVAMSFKKDIVVNSGWQIVCNDPAIKEFMETALKRMQEDGSLQMSFEDTLRDMLSAYEYGFCLHGDTLIHTPSGDFRIKDLVGKNPYVFSWVDGELKLAQAKRVWLTKKGEECIRIRYEWHHAKGKKFDELICTKNHPIMMRDGTFKKAGDICTGDRLMPFSQKIGLPGYKPRAFVQTRRGYGKGLWRKRSWFAYEQTNGPIPEGYHIHHKDENTLNDDPGNLEAKPGSGALVSHAAHHSKKWWANATPEQLAASRDKHIAYFSDPEFSAAWSARSSESNRKTWADPEIRRKRSESISRTMMGRKPPLKTDDGRRRISEAKKAWWAKKKELLAIDNHTVVSIEPAGNHDVYDMEVPGTHNFSANHIVVHNSCSEPIFKIKNGNYVYDSIRVRPPQSFRFVVDDYGTTTEIIQMSNRGELHFDPKLFLHHVYQVQYGNPYGKSDLRAAFPSWKAKKFAAKFLAIYLERFGSPLPVGKYPATMDGDEVKAFAAMLKSIQQTSSLTIPDNVIVDFVQANKDSADIYIKALDYYNMHIGRALLVPDLLGISGAKTGGGSFALGRDQFTMFLSTLEKDRQSLSRKITLRIINPLVNVNFGYGIECDFEFLPFAMDQNEKMLEVWSNLVRFGVFRPNDEEINHVRSEISFPNGPVILGEVQVKKTPGVDVNGPNGQPLDGQPGNPPAQAGPTIPAEQPKAQFSQSRPVVRRTTFQGLPINVEIEKGQAKGGVGPDGQAWSHLYAFPYGEIASTRGADADPVDCYIGPNDNSQNVYVVHQLDPQGKFDEDKAFLGFDSPAQAKQAYLTHGPSFGFGSLDSMTLSEFKNGYLASNRHFKAFKSARRESTSAEKKVNFTQIQKSMDSADNLMRVRLKRTANQIWKDLAAQIKDSGLIRNFNPQRLNELKPRFLRDMNQELKHGFRDLLEQSYAEAHKELFPNDTKNFGLDAGELSYDDMMAVLDAEAFNITADYAGLASKKVNSIIAQGLKQQKSEAEIMQGLRDELPDDTDTWINTLLRTKTTEIYNRGRKSYFDNDPLAQQVIDGYQFSAVLDARTTQICLSLDKKVFRSDDDNINLLTPPLHWNCRSVIVPVTIYEKDDMENAEDVPDEGKLQEMGANLLSEKAKVVRA